MFDNFLPCGKANHSLVSVFCFILFETGSLYVALIGLEVTTAGWTGQIDLPAGAPREL